MSPPLWTKWRTRNCGRHWQDWPRGSIGGADSRGLDRPGGGVGPPQSALCVTGPPSGHAVPHVRDAVFEPIAPTGGSMNLSRRSLLLAPVALAPVAPALLSMPALAQEADPR